jgi:DNA-binding Lrp family transcriptional regulator
VRHNGELSLPDLAQLIGVPRETVRDRAKKIEAGKAQWGELLPEPQPNTKLKGAHYRWDWMVVRTWANRKGIALLATPAHRRRQFEDSFRPGWLEDR